MSKSCRLCNTPLLIGENTTKARIRNSDYKCKPCNNKYLSGVSKARYHIRKEESLPGVYMIFENNILVYIGESSTVYNRIWNHFHTSPITKNAIGVDKKNKDDYECIQICVEDNLHKRLALELELIAVYKPKYNSPYKNIYADNPLVYPLVDNEILFKKRVLESLDFDPFAINGF